MSIKKITPENVYRLNQESGGISIIDVREVHEFQEVSSPIATNLPLSTFNASEFAEKHDKKSQVYVLCRSGKRSMTCAQILESSGFESVYNIEGGMLAWEESGLPVVRKRSA